MAILVENKTLLPTMYNRNYGGFDYVRIHSELLTSVLNRKTLSFNPVTDGYTRPLAFIDHELKIKLWQTQKH